jgi:signal transduction histidine kinase
MSTEVRPAFPPEFQSALPDLVDALEVGVIVVDKELVVRGWNRWMESTSGRAGGAVIGEHITTVFPDIRPVVLDALRSALDGKPTVLSQSLHRFAFALPAPAGCESLELMQQTTRFAPLDSDAGAARGAIAFVQDVSERVARERDLRAATERAESANRSKSDFLATMSHELRTPIGAMTGYTDLVLEGIYGPVTDAQRQHLERVKSVGKHLLNIVEEILLFARVEAGREETHLAQVDAFQIARDAVAVVDPIAREKGIALVASIPGAPALATTDEVKVRQILINLLGNAVKFTAKGEVSIEARVEDRNGSVVYVVRDTGTGIAPENLDRIFEPFTQLENAYSRTQSGTGLGLPVSRRLARMLGGDLTAHSQPGRGSVFIASVSRSGPDSG